MGKTSVRGCGEEMEGDYDEILSERAAIMEFDGKLSRKWAEWLAELTLKQKPEGYLDSRWEIIKTDAGLFLDQWDQSIDKEGWEHKDIQGLVEILDGNPVIKFGVGYVVIKLPSGREERVYYRPSPGGVARWDMGKRRG